MPVVIVTWVDGTVGVEAEWEPLAAARDLAAFVSALQRADATGAPAGRDRLADRGPEVRDRVEQLGAAALEAWDDALAAPSWDGPPVWHHGDLDARNWLVRDDRITAVIDWGSAGAGDPAADVMAAWKLHSADAVAVFADALDVDDSTWRRARGWAVQQAAAGLTYYTPENNGVFVSEAARWLDLALEVGWR